MRQRGKASWELRVFLGPDPVTGKKRWAIRTVRGPKREAQSALAALVTEATRGGLVATGETVGALLERWFEHARPDLSPKTVLETRGVLDRYLLPALRAVKVAKLRTDDIDRFYRRLAKGGGQGGKPLAPATVRRIHGILRRALGQGVRWGWMAQNPAALASPPKVPPTDIHPPAPEGIARVFALARDADPDLATFIVLAAGTGARRSELIALRWADVDVGAGRLRIGRGIVSSLDGLVEKDTKTHAVRTLALDPTSLSLLREHRQRAVERATACGVTLGDGGYVFTVDVEGAHPWRPDRTTRAFQRLCRKAGLGGVRLHDLRHYVATRLLASGVDVRTVAGRLGHRNASTTLNVYSHFLPEADREAADLLGRLFDGAVSERGGR